jgi:hypothetical protein
MFSSTDPKIEEMKTKPDYNQPIFRNPPQGGPWGYARIFWVNDRYYKGKYYPAPENK